MALRGLYYRTARLQGIGDDDGRVAALTEQLV
jgi:hypothetical protein